jgi:hypothetical protein
MNSQTMPAPVSDDSVIEQLEAEFLRGPSHWPSPSEINVEELLAPAIYRTQVDPVCRSTRIKSRYGGCCG